MIKKSKQAAGFIAVCLLFLPVFLSSCTPSLGNSRPLLWYAPHSFPFEMTLPTTESSFILHGERTPDSVTLTVISPKRSAGLSVVYTNGNCTLSQGDTQIPLSKEAAKGLTSLLDGLLLSSADGAKTGSSAEGFPTITVGDLTLIFDENGLPKEIYNTKTGRWAALSVLPENITDQNPPDQQNKDRKNNEHQTENNSGDLGIRADS